VVGEVEPGALEEAVSRSLLRTSSPEVRCAVVDAGVADHGLQQLGGLAGEPQKTRADSRQPTPEGRAISSTGPRATAASLTRRDSPTVSSRWDGVGRSATSVVTATIPGGPIDDVIDAAECAADLVHDPPRGAAVAVQCLGGEADPRHGLGLVGRQRRDRAPVPDVGADQQDREQDERDDDAEVHAPSQADAAGRPRRRGARGERWRR
jgi:hypothetical protein